jgi:hypothetical protein
MLRSLMEEPDDEWTSKNEWSRVVVTWNLTLDKSSSKSDGKAGSLPSDSRNPGNPEIGMYKMAITRSGSASGWPKRHAAKQSVSTFRQLCESKPVYDKVADYRVRRISSCGEANVSDRPNDDRKRPIQTVCTVCE